jgi:uncharacterized protein
MSALTEQQSKVVSAVVAEEAARREHLVIAVSGAHAYGFPSPDSDVDLKAVHVVPTDALLGLSDAELAASRMEVIDGVEIDYTSNEIGAVLLGLLAGNGNYLERILGAITVHESAELEGLKPLARRTLSRRYHRHYRGFAFSQLEALRSATPGTAKKALYVLRTTLTGAHLLKTGTLVTDVTRLLDEYGFAAAAALVERKQRAERVALDDAERDTWLRQLDRAFTVLDEAEQRSALPTEAQTRAELDAWLVALRRRR